MISTRLVELVIDTVVCLTLAKWETVSGQFGGYLNRPLTALVSRDDCSSSLGVACAGSSDQSDLRSECGGRNDGPLASARPFRPFARDKSYAAPGCPRKDVI